MDNMTLVFEQSQAESMHLYSLERVESFFEALVNLYVERDRETATNTQYGKLA